MAHLVYAVSSEWAGTLGGINIFNRFLVEALARVVDTDVEIHAVVAQASGLPAGVGTNLLFQRYAQNAESLAEVVKADVAKLLERPASITLLGHDVHTGSHAVDARDLLRAAGISSEAAVFSHMDYSKYGVFKDALPPELAVKRDRQRAVIAAADHVYAVGPLLVASFERLRREQGHAAAIHEIIPGFPQALTESRVRNPSDALKFFFSGRIDAENDRVKNGRLALKALFHCYNRNVNQAESRWTPRGFFTAYGFTGGKIDEAWFCEGIDRVELKKRLTLTLQGFAPQDEMFVELRDSHIALMPSVQEGFGLSGWEAVCAGIPLICSDQSGLAEFLRQRCRADHDLNIESVRMVRLGDSDADVQAVSSEIEKLTADYDRALTHARRLAEHLQTHFTWEEAARKVASVLGLARSGSVDWKARQYQGRVALTRQRAQGDEQTREVRKALDFAASGQALTEWSVTCTALNYLSDLGKRPTYASRDNAITQLQAISVGVLNGYDADVRAMPGPRTSGRFDVAWRFMAAAASIEPTLKSFLECIPEPMMREIRVDSFLKRELLYYVTKYASEFGDTSRQVAIDFFKKISCEAIGDDALQVRLARLVAAVPDLEHVIDLDCATGEAFVKAREQCARVQASTFDLSELLAQADALAPTALALASIDKRMRGRGIEQIFEAWQEHEALPTPDWRGDKLLRAALLAASIHPRNLLALIDALAEDEEEALRWAAIDLAFSPALRLRLFSASELGTIDETTSQLKARLGSIVDKAVATGDFHPWMQREFLTRFRQEHVTPLTSRVEHLFYASDFPVARTLMGPPAVCDHPWRFAILHPEVQIEAYKLRETAQRILLVLPPISLDVNARHVSETSTPPLGLGLIGSHLLAAGHDVYIADCHRAPATRDTILRSANAFDWIGFNVVLPTMRSVLAMATAIKALPGAPAIVVGGPAVNSRSFRNSATSDAERRCWDFEISASAITNFAYLVAAAGKDGGGELPSGIIPNERSEFVITAGHSLMASPTVVAQVSGWPEPVLMDRRLFSTPAGVYEPHRTRAIGGTAVEAHVVMSQGCNWNCTFCTERFTQSGGERRRSVSSVESELVELVKSNPDLRVQFVDDNLLPQVATLTDRRVAQAEAIDWAEHFLALLLRLRKAASIGFGWRGIFRVEDFFLYEKILPNFIQQLADSGCRMLAFGVEHGNEATRRKMKAGGSANNTEFADLFQRLRVAGIHSKAYFILGGPNESVETSSETIAFAINSGVSLAYFALYKEFIPALKNLQSEQSLGSDLHQRYSAYEQLDISWDAILEGALIDPGGATFTDLVERIASSDAPLNVATIIAVYDELSRLGFRFLDLVKYSDQHADNGPASEVLKRVNFGNCERFEATVASAYLRFYLRPDFVETYRSLLADGY